MGHFYPVKLTAAVKPNLSFDDHATTVGFGNPPDQLSAVRQLTHRNRDPKCGEDALALVFV
jgi:hypothetical protein